MIVAYVDVKCPASYLAFAPIMDLAARSGVDIDWKPFRSRQSSIPDEHRDETKGERHRRVRAIQRRETHLRYAAVRGLTMDFRDDPGETDAALAALLCGLDRPEAFLEQAFQAYWDDDVDLNDDEQVRALLRKSGNTGVAERFALERTDLEACQTDTEEVGIFFTPTFVVGDQLFVGREHLPLIEAILTSSAKAPD